MCDAVRCETQLTTILDKAAMYAARVRACCELRLWQCDERRFVWCGLVAGDGDVCYNVLLFSGLGSDECRHSDVYIRDVYNIV